MRLPGDWFKRFWFTTPVKKLPDSHIAKEGDETLDVGVADGICRLSVNFVFLSTLDRLVECVVVPAHLCFFLSSPDNDLAPFVVVVFKRHALGENSRKVAG